MSMLTNFIIHNALQCLRMVISIVASLHIIIFIKLCLLVITCIFATLNAQNLNNINKITHQIHLNINQLTLKQNEFIVEVQTTTFMNATITTKPIALMHE